MRQKTNHQISMSVVPQVGQFNIVTKDYFSMLIVGVVLMLLSYAGDFPHRGGCHI
jgi:hypothetical protein